MAKTIDYTIVRSNRKTIALVVDSAANLIVRAPLYANESEIEKIVENKRRWIAEKQYQVSVFSEQHTPVVFENGESLLYMGKSYTILRESISEIKIEGFYIYIPLDYKTANVIIWLRTEAQRLLIERVERYANIMGTKPTSVNITDAKARWGSCSTNNKLNFSWRLIMCPVTVIDYIVVHELSHISYKNHSPAFWARVKTILPNYIECQDWLKVNRKIMEII